MINLKSPTPSSPTSELNTSQNTEKKLMNRNELQLVIINKFIKDYPNVNEQLIENVVKDYLKKLNSKLTQLNLKELKNIIQELVQDDNFSKKSYISSNSPSNLNPLIPNNISKFDKTNDDESHNNSINGQNNQIQVKKIVYPAFSQIQKGRSLSPERSLNSTSSSFQQLNQQLGKTSSNAFLPKYQRSKSPQPNENQVCEYMTIQDIKNIQKNNTQSSNNIQNNNNQNIGIKSILKRTNRSLSPIQKRQTIQTQNKTNDDNCLVQNNKPKLQSLNYKQSETIEKDASIQGIQINKRHSSPIRESDQIQDGQYTNNLNVDLYIAQNRLQNIEKSQSSENKNTLQSQKQLDDTIKDLQRNNYNIINGVGVNQINKTSYWSHLEDVQQNLKKNDQNSHEWRKKFDDIKNLRIEHQIQEELKKEQYLNEILYNDYQDDSMSQKSTNETVKGYEMRKNKGALCEILSQQQYVDINYAEQVKRNLQEINKEEQLLKKKKQEQQKYLKQFYDAQVTQKKNMIDDQIEQDKQFIVMSQILQEQEKMEQKNMELCKMIKKTREDELTAKEKEKQSQKEKGVEQNKLIREKYEREEQSEKEGNFQRKKEQHDFYVKAIQTHQSNNIKQQQEAEEKRLDKIYMANYTNLLDQQEEYRLTLNQQRQKELQQFVKKQVENHPKLREKKFKQEERDQISQKMQLIVDNDIVQSKNLNQQKRQLQEQMKNFLTQQIEQKKSLQQKNYIDYDRIQQEACEIYNQSQQEYENKIQQHRKQQEIDNFQYLNQQIQSNQIKNTKYFYPLAYNQIIPQTNNSSPQSLSTIQQ